MYCFHLSIILCPSIGMILFILLSMALWTGDAWNRNLQTWHRILRVFHLKKKLNSKDSYFLYAHLWKKNRMHYSIKLLIHIHSIKEKLVAKSKEAMKDSVDVSFVLCDSGFFFANVDPGIVCSYSIPKAGKYGCNSRIKKQICSNDNPIFSTAFVYIYRIGYFSE